MTKRLKTRTWLNRRAAPAFGKTALAAVSLLSPLMLSAAPEASNTITASKSQQSSICSPNWKKEQSAWQRSVLSQALTGLTSSHSSSLPIQPYRFHDDHVLGTSLDIIALAPNEAAAQQALQAAKAKIAHLDSLLSSY